MTPRAPHPTPHAGASCAPARRTVRAARKNVVRCDTPRAIPAPAHGARCADGTGVMRIARVTATSNPTQSA